MKYIANPVEVDAFKIVEVGEPTDAGIPLYLELETGTFIATKEMTSRMTPMVGDYWVIQSDGYVYLNPKDVFERKYRPLQAKRPTIEELQSILDSEEPKDVVINADGSITTCG